MIRRLWAGIWAYVRPQSISFTVTVVVENDEDGTFYAYAPALSGLHVGGKTEEEAKKNAEDAVVLYLTSHIRHGDPLPIGANLSVEREEPLLPIEPAPSSYDVTVEGAWSGISGTSSRMSRQAV
jgi:predicted RNase H-like HicB family nuclease